MRQAAVRASGGSGSGPADEMADAAYAGTVGRSKDAGELDAALAAVAEATNSEAALAALLRAFSLVAEREVRLDDGHKAALAKLMATAKHR